VIVFLRFRNQARCRTGEVIMRPQKRFGICALVLAAALTAAAQGPPQAGQAPPRDGQQPAVTGTATIRGLVVQLDTGQPVRRVQVSARRSEAASQPDSVMTDAEGRFELTKLPAGSYQLSAAKAGYVTLQHGQRRPLEPGRPLVVAEGQRIDNVNFSLPRGSVIVGQVVDEYGDPVTGANVQAQRYRFVNGQRRLTAAGGDPSTDDRGQFRIFGLLPGQYYVSAAPPGGALAAVAALAAGGGFGDLAPITFSSASGYTRTYYPDSPSPATAQPVSLGVGEESPLLVVQLVASRTATVSGAIVGGDQENAFTRMVMIRPRGSAPDSALVGGNMAQAQNGRFTLTGVVPGDYTIDAMMMNIKTIPPQIQYGSTDIVVGGTDIHDVVIRITPGATARGRIRFEDGDPGSIRRNQVRLGATPAAPSLAPVQERVNDDWTFEIAGLTGAVTLRADAPAPWTLKRILRGTTDITDAPVELSNDNDDLTIVLTTRATEVSGIVRDSRGASTTDYVALWFADDRARWGPQTRFIKTARPDRDGQYRIRGLPPGRYLAVALEYLEPGEELDPDRLDEFRRGAIAVDVREAETRSVDLRRFDF
jgi:protocatechuate 3,4-dioxygenase beta subunit